MAAERADELLRPYLNLGFNRGSTRRLHFDMRNTRLSSCC